jgi:mono/diheme cytochrome c family protein
MSSPRFVGLALGSGLAVVSLVALSGCRREGEHVDAGTLAKAEDTRAPEVAKAPPVPGDYQHGWSLFLEHCANCHGASRRGAGVARGGLLRAPADLRDPVFLASRTDDELARAILEGGVFVGRTRWMPGFSRELSEQDALDIVALMRGDSIYLGDCFPTADLYVSVDLRAPGPPVLAAYDSGTGEGNPPRVVNSADLVPPDAALQGYVMFAEVSLGKAGQTPVAFVADDRGRISGMRVGLPKPDNERAQRDLEDTVIRKKPRLPKLTKVLDEGVKRLTLVATRREAGSWRQ